jgi:hypothetical protein
MSVYTAITGLELDAEVGVVASSPGPPATHQEVLS